MILNKIKANILRETWEHPGYCYYAPAILTTVLLCLMLGLFVSVKNGNSFDININIETSQQQEFSIDDEMEALLPEPRGNPGYAFFEQLNKGSTGIFSAILHLGLALALLYLVTSLSTDRRDRSILFWKSMPVSETIVVGAKLAFALVVIPLMFYLSAVVCQLCYWLVAINLASHLTMPIGDFELQSLMHSFVEQIRWLIVRLVLLSPIAAYLMLCSTLTRRSPLLTAAVPIIAIVVVETIVLGHSQLQVFVAESFGFNTQDNQPSIEPSIQQSLQQSMEQVVNLETHLASGVAAARLSLASVLIAVAIFIRNHRFD